MKYTDRMFIYYEISNIIIFLPLIIAFVFVSYSVALIFLGIALLLADLYCILYYEKTVLNSDNSIVIYRAFKKKVIMPEEIKTGCLCKTSFLWKKRAFVKPQIVKTKIEIVRNGEKIVKKVPKITVFFVERDNNIPQLLLLDSYAFKARGGFLISLPLESPLAREMIKRLDPRLYINENLFKAWGENLHLHDVHLI